MTPRFKITVARRCAPRVKELRGEAKKSFERVVEELRHRGCAAGGTRMRAETGDDHRVCERRFYRDWRMHLVFGDQNDIVISWVGRHTEDEPVHLEGARNIPGLSGVGRPRDRHDPPAEPDLVRLVNQISPRPSPLARRPHRIATVIRRSICIYTTTW